MCETRSCGTSAPLNRGHTHDMTPREFRISRRRAASVLLAVAASPSAQAHAQGLVRHHGSLLKLGDLDLALSFFANGLGFGTAEYEPRRGWARLASNQAVYLEQSNGRAQPETAACAKVTFQTAALDVMIVHLTRAGAVTVSDIRNVAVGRSILFRDPTGIVHSILQPNYTLPPFAEPRVYNSGLHVPQAHLAATRTLLEQGMGFVPLTERYFPPSVPYLEGDRSFSFMLHHNQPEEADFAVREGARSDDLGTWEVFTTEDLIAAARACVANGATQLQRRPSAFPRGERLAFLTPGGAPFELWSLR